MPDEHGTVVIGVIADTHIPDRAETLPEGILTKFQEAHVDRILHAGDASCWEVVRVLETVAPVTLVQGNRDWLYRMRTHRSTELTINTVRITLTHGHRSMLHYVFDKWSYLTKGYCFERYYRYLSQDFPDSDVIIFGHTHYQTAKWVDGQLFFNPGAAYACTHNQFNPQFGLLRITSDGEIQTETHSLH